MIHFLQRPKTPSLGLMASKLFDQDTFYPAFMNDIRKCKHNLIIECPFITTKRLETILPVFRRLKQRGVNITVNTRDPHVHDDYLRLQAEASLVKLHAMGINVLYTGGHHRKLVIIDRSILYEGSLNVLSQNESCEIMRRIESEELATQMVGFTGLGSFCEASPRRVVSELQPGLSQALWQSP